MTKGRIYARVACSLMVAVLVSGMGRCYCKSQPVGAPGKGTPREAAKWVIVQAGGLSFRAPAAWKVAELIPDGVKGAGRYAGSDEREAEAVFCCVYDKQEHLDKLSEIGVTKKTRVKVAGVKAMQYAFNRKKWPSQGLLLISDRKYADGTRLIVIAGTHKGEWKNYEPTLRKMMASVKIIKEPAKSSGG